MDCLDKVRVTNSGYLRVCHDCNGCLDTLAELPSENVEKDMIYFVRETELYYSWDGTNWNPTGGEFELAETGGGGGSTPTIGDNGNWYIDGEDTGKPSRGEKGDPGEKGEPGPKGDPGVIEKYPDAMISEYDYETGEVMVSDSDEGLEYETALTLLKNAVNDVIDGVNKNKEKIENSDLDIGSITVVQSLDLNGNSFLKKSNRNVTLSFAGTATKVINCWSAMARIPKEFAPTNNMYFAGSLGGSNSMQIILTSAGDIMTGSNVASGTGVYFTVSYIV